MTAPRAGRRLAGLLLVAAPLAAVACGEEPVAPAEGVERLEFEPASLDFGDAADGLSAEVSLRNAGGVDVGPIELVGGPVRLEGGAEIPGARLEAAPPEIATLAPGASVPIAVSIALPAGAAAGAYRSSLEARLGGQAAATLGLVFSIAVTPGPPVASIEIAAAPSAARQGDVVRFEAVARDADGAVVAQAAVAWSLIPGGAGLITSEGRFVGYEPGPVRVSASSGGVSDTVQVEVTVRGAPAGSFAVAGHGAQTARFNSDLWVRGDVAYSGTWGQRTESGTALSGNRLFAWDISNPAAPRLTDSVMVDARTVNDVKIRDDGALAVLTHEVSNDGRNGITLLDMTPDPHHPRVITRFMPMDLSPGVHNVWIEGDYVYAVVDGISEASGLRVIDVSDPSRPTIAAAFYAGSSFLHDVYVRDGLAFLSHWDAGLVILDVGHGMAGGSPESPREVSRVLTAGGQTHNAWYWPEGALVFVGEEDFATPGMMHVVDVNDLRNPREVASFAVAGETPHNFWLDEERRILYLAWYRQGLRALDVSGELLGALERQGREVASSLYGAGSFCFAGEGTCTWAPQLQDGLVWVSDLNTGIWALRPSF